MVGLAILFVRFQGVGEISGHAILQLLQKAKDLAAPRCMTAEIAEQARSEPQDSWIGTCLNLHHFEIQSRNQDIWLPFMKVMVTPAVCPRLFELGQYTQPPKVTVTEQFADTTNFGLAAYVKGHVSLILVGVREELLDHDALPSFRARRAC